MAYNTDIGNDDQYKATTPAVGLYEFTVYCADPVEYWQGAAYGKLVVDTASGAACNSALQGNNDVYHNGLLHNSFSTSYRDPIGRVDIHHLRYFTLPHLHG